MLENLNIRKENIDEKPRSLNTVILKIIFFFGADIDKIYFGYIIVVEI